MVSETNAAYHVNSPFGQGVGQLATQQSWWRQFITNATFLSSHPEVKAICLFEFMKYEETFADGTPSLRDFRISNDTEIRNAFLRDFEAVKSFYVAGNYSQTSTSSQSPGPSPTNPTKETDTSTEKGKTTNAASPFPLFSSTLVFVLVSMTLFSIL